MGQYVFTIKNKGVGLGLRKSILEIRLDGVQPLANLQKYFGKVFQTPFEMLLKPSVTQIGTFYSVCTIWRADFGSLSFYDNYLTKASWVKFFFLYENQVMYTLSLTLNTGKPTAKVTITIKRVDFGSRSFHGNYLTKVSWVKSFF